MKKILIISANTQKIIPWLGLFDELLNKGYSFYLAGKDNLKFIKNKKPEWKISKIFFSPVPEHLVGKIFYFILNILLFPYYLIYFFYLKNKGEISAIICLGDKEAAAAILPAAFLKIKILWFLENDSRFLKKRPSFIFSLALKIGGRKISIIAPNDYLKEKIKSWEIKDQYTKIIYPGIKLNKHEYQDNIFSGLARAKGENLRQKFFTLGICAKLDKNQGLETLFNAVKICLPIIPNLQLIIMGDGEEKKNFSWLAKKMEIETITWFVGEQARLNKWLEGINCFIVLPSNRQLNDQNNVLSAMGAGRPVIAPNGAGFEEIMPQISRESGCIVKQDDVETLARQIIKLWRNKILRSKIKQANIEMVEKYFSAQKQAAEFEKIIYEK
mgnify:CR=1 FL=1